MPPSLAVMIREIRCGPSLAADQGRGLSLESGECDKTDRASRASLAHGDHGYRAINSS
jgi:hypothetical protein